MALYILGPNPVPGMSKTPIFCNRCSKKETGFCSFGVGHTYTILLEVKDSSPKTDDL